MRFPILAAIAAASISTSVHAENWQFLSRNDQSAHVVEVDSVKKTATGARIWTASISSTPKAPVRGVFGNDIQVTRTLYEVDCVGERIRGLQTGYMTKGLDPRGDFNPPAPQWTYPAPGTIGLGILKVACRKENLDLVGSGDSLRDSIEQYFMWRQFEGYK